MKKLLAMLIAAGLFVFVVSFAFAAGEPAKNAEPAKSAEPAKTVTGIGIKNTGCGLGSMVWKNRADDSSLFQAFQATTNGSSSQTIAISLGTSQCDQPATFVSNERLKEFVVANMDNLAKDIAAGRGETLETYAELMQVPAENRPEFYRKLQNNFTNIFTSEKVVLANVIDNTATVLAKN